jgi:hypothetical protein
MFGERFEVRGDAFNHPEIAYAADLSGGWLRFLKELMDGLVVQRGGVLVGAREEMGLAVGVEVDSQRFGNARLTVTERGDVFLPGAMVVHAERAHLATRRALSAKQRSDFSLGEIEPREQLPPHLVQPLKLGGQLGCRLEAVIGCNEKVIGAKLPAVLHFAMSCGGIFGR